MRIRQVGWIVPLLLATALPVLAQQGTSEIGGRVTDEQGAVLPGVSIVVTNEETGIFREVTSGADGSYFASQLTPAGIVSKRSCQASARSSGAVSCWRSARR